MNKELVAENFKTAIISFLETYYHHAYSLKMGLLDEKIIYQIGVQDDFQIAFLSGVIESLLNPLGKDDYFYKPKDDGFKASVYYFNEEGNEIEIQVMTLSMMENFVISDSKSL